MATVEPTVVPLDLDLKPQLGPLVAQMRELGIRRLKLDDIEIELEAKGELLSTFAEPAKAAKSAHSEPTKTVSGGIKTMLYSQIFVVIDGYLQAEEQSVRVSHGKNDEGQGVIRLDMKSAVPAEGLEFDGAKHVGTDRLFTISLLVGNGSVYQHRMKLVSFELTHSVEQPAAALACFEAPLVTDTP